MIDDLPWVALAALTILALLRITRTMRDSRRTRLSEKQKFAIAQAAHEAKQPRDYSTATCPICGKYDASRPFISYAIDCHRKDCGMSTKESRGPEPHEREAWDTQRGRYG